MNKVRYINLDRREWFEISSYGSIMAHNSAVEAKSKGPNWTNRQQSTRYGAKYDATIMVYGHVLLMSETPVTSELHDLIGSAQSRERVGSWHGNRIVVQYVQNTGNYVGVQCGGMTNVTQDVKSMGLAYLKYDKVLL